MTEENLWSGLNNEMNQEHHGYIESWFEATINPHHVKVYNLLYHVKAHKL